MPRANEPSSPPATRERGSASERGAGDARATKRLAKIEWRRLDRALHTIADGAVAGAATHALRIATRRTGAVLSVLGLGGAGVDDDVLSEAQKWLKRVRKAASGGREADVLLGLVKARLGSARTPAGERVAWELLRRELRARRKDARRSLVREIKRLRRRRPAALRKALARKVAGLGHDADAGAERAHGALAPASLVRAAVPRMLSQVRACAGQDLRDLDHAHALRVQLKGLRYALEVFGHAGEPGAAERSVATLSEVQRALGEAQDLRALVELIREVGTQEAQRGPKGQERVAHLARVLVREERALKVAHQRGLKAWRSAVEAGLLRLAEEAAQGEREERSEPRPPAVLQRPARELRLAGLAVPLPTGDLTRLAAIDVGSNSIRLIVAEAQTDGSYRVLDDEREMARLAQGLDATGRLDERAMDRAARAIAHMHQIARGLGASRVRAVATAAVREAKNGGEFVKMIRRLAGLDLEVIGAEQEAVLAYRSIAAAFDLSLLTVAVVDIGGGSTQVVLAAGGVVEKVYTIPLGAVRLTERFGGGESAAGRRYADLRAYLRDLMRKHLGALPLSPQIVIATGGTATTLGAVALQHGHGPDDLAPGAAVQGLEMKRSTVGRIARQLRSLSLEQRARVPGLAAERADIIVPGVSILRAVMRQLGTKRLRIHTGGIRDGLLLAMVAEMYPGAEAAGGVVGGGARDPLRSVYRLARACRFDQRHSEQVARVSLRLHEQLAALEARGGEVPAWAGEDARFVLHASALLLDIGYLISYAQHHQHSYNLIRHSDLPGLGARQVEMIAAVARYHRGSDPKPRHEAVKQLNDVDRGIVRALAGIVRVAVGLDRGHRQIVRDVRVAPAPGGVRISVDAEGDPSVDIWAAQRKSGLLSSVLDRAVLIEAGRTGLARPGEAGKRAADEPAAGGGRGTMPSRGARWNDPGRAGGVGGVVGGEVGREVGVVGGAAGAAAG